MSNYPTAAVAFNLCWKSMGKHTDREEKVKMAILGFLLYKQWIMWSGMVKCTAIYLNATIQLNYIQGG